MLSEDLELLRQFIPEARDLLDQAGTGLLEVERNPETREAALIGVFRAVHTLKGTSGLFPVPSLTRVVHAAEDLLGAFREAREPFPPEAADVLLAGFDQVGHWIDALDSDAALPSDADDMADSLVARIRGARPVTAEEIVEAEATAEEVGGWADGLDEASKRICRPEGDMADLVAIEFRPDQHCFFRGEDPAQLIRQVPGLRLLRVEPAEPWAPLEALDAFNCNLVLRAVAATGPEAAGDVFGMSRDFVKIHPLPPHWPASPSTAPEAPTLRTILLTQRALLSAPPDSAIPLADLVASVEAALLEGLARAGVEANQGVLLSQCAAASLSERNTGPLLAFTANLLTSLDPPPPPVQERPHDPKPSGPPMLRVEQGRVDKLMTLVGELVVAKNSLAYLASRAENGTWDSHARSRGPEASSQDHLSRDLGRIIAREIQNQQAQFNRIAEELQAAVMAVRMSPLSQVFQRFPRLVRDQSRRLGKEIDLVLEGEHTEADKNMVEALADPLIHMMRNSLDHGFEPPEEREALGKPRQGLLRLTAEQENDTVVVRLIDDGRGINPELVRRRAIQTGLLDEARASGMTDDQLIQLVFEPGFTTSETVSDLSGRGVGMDAVRGAVEKLGGQVFLDSKVGVGTSVTLTLPLTLAVTRIMTIEAGGGRLFGVPMGIIVETVRIPRKAIRKIKNAEAFTLRDSVVPLVRLNRLLDLPSGPPREDEAILVIRIAGERMGIVVDTFREGMEVIVKPMDGALADLRGFAGTTLLGDGRVLLILDLRELL